MEIKVSQTVFKLRAIEYDIPFFSKSDLQGFCQKVSKRANLFNSTFKNPFQDVVCYGKLGCLTL